MTLSIADIENELNFWDKHFEDIMLERRIPEESQIPSDELRGLLRHFIAERDYYEVMLRITRLRKELEMRKKNNLLVNLNFAF
ncbi:MAG: hypothetical protein AB1458_15730 [Bacteroidota bacterium]